MMKIVRYTCSTCGKEYLSVDDALKCEKRHDHEYEVLRVNKEEYELPDFPEKIWIERKRTSKRCRYRIDGSSPDLVWKPFYEISKDIHIDILLDTLLKGTGIPKSIIEETDPVEYAKIVTMNRDNYDLFI